MGVLRRGVGGGVSDLKCQKLKSVIARVICDGIFVGGGVGVGVLSRF